MLQLIMSMYRAFEEGLGYMALAGNYQGEPVKMAGKIRALLASRYEPQAQSEEMSVTEERIEMVAA